MSKKSKTKDQVKKEVDKIMKDPEVKKATSKTKKAVKSALAIDCYKSTTGDEIGRSKEHEKHMRKTRKKNFARKMKLIDPHYGKKATGIIVGGAVAGLAAGVASSTVPSLGMAVGPAVGGGVIISGLAYLETEAHRKVGDHAILDSLMDDRDDNWRTNTTMDGYDGHGDNVQEHDRNMLLNWSDDEDDLDNLLPSEMIEEEGENESEVTDSTSATTSSSFDAIFGTQPEEDLLSSMMQGMGTTDKPTSSVPRPPSPEFGQRATNPHSSKTVQLMGNEYKAPKKPETPAVEEDFFAQLMKPAPLSPTVNTLTPTPVEEVDFFADFGGSKIASTPVEVAKPEPKKKASFFGTIAAAIPSQPKPNDKASSSASDPFADLYANATGISS